MNKTVTEQIEDAIAEARIVIREAHVATKDLRTATKDALKSRESLDEYVSDRVRQTIDGVVRVELEALGNFQRTAYDQIAKGFDTAIQPLMDSLEMIRTNMPMMGELPRPRKMFDAALSVSIGPGRTTVEREVSDDDKH